MFVLWAGDDVVLKEKVMEGVKFKNLPSTVLFQKNNLHFHDSAKFHFIYLSNLPKDTVFWKLGSIDTLMHRINKDTVSIESLFASEQMKKYIDYNDSLICVGTASYEVDTSKGKDWEIKRTDLRAKRIAFWLKEYYPNNHNLFTVNLGIFKGGNKVVKSPLQRRMLLIKVADRENDATNIEEALYDSFKRHANLQVDSYSEPIKINKLRVSKNEFLDEKDKFINP